MHIDNKKTIVSYNIQRILVFIFVAVAIATIVIPGVLPYNLLKGYDTQVIITLIILYFIYVGINAVRDIHYLYFDVTKKHIIIRFISVQPFKQSRKEIKVARRELKGYKITRSFGGLKKQLILFVNTPKGTAKYPPISISLVPETQLLPILKTLKAKH